MVTACRTVKMSSTGSSNSETQCCNFFNFNKNDLIKSGFYRTKLYQNVVCCGCGWQSDNAKVTIRHLNFIHKLNNPDCVMSKHIPEELSNFAAYKKNILKIEEIMKETFLFWPKSYPGIDVMIEAGLYYVGIDDVTSCVSCGVTLQQWKPDDDPREKHRKVSPFCELVKLYTVLRT